MSAAPHRAPGAARPGPPGWSQALSQHLLGLAEQAAGRLDRLGPLPPAWRPWQQRLAGALQRLPSAPPSALAAAALNRALWPRLPAELRRALPGRVLCLEATDLGWRIRLRGGPSGFIAAGDGGAPDALRIAARASAWWALARGTEDPDRLFFDRALVMEGDTDLGLLLKNSLDALGPLWPVAAPPR